MKNMSKILSISFAVLMIILILLFPDISSKGISRGLIIAANVVIPSLFPFMVCVLMIIKSGFTINNELLEKILYKIFGHNFDMFFVFILSMIGGYPVGAKLINELCSQKIINEKTANLVLAYCVNAGPAFVVLIVGGAFNSKKIGFLLLVSHLLSSLIIALFSAKSLKRYIIHSNKVSVFKSFSDNFVESVADASSSILSICSFVILFSGINSYIDYFFSNMTSIKLISLFTEVTSAVVNCKNIYIISFLLGFSGISIWCQVFTITKNMKINKFRFVLSRIMHGTISVIITKILILIFKIKITTYNNNINIEKEFFYTNEFLFCSMLIMMMVLLVFLYLKNNSGKLINDVI